MVFRSHAQHRRYSVTVAEAYLPNASEATRNDLASISTDLNQQFKLYNDDRPAFVSRVARHAAFAILQPHLYLTRAKTD